MKTTIEMAREAAGDDWGLFQEYMPEIHRLVELVRADERAQRTWVGLTDEEMQDCIKTADYNQGQYKRTAYWAHLATAIEQALKEKNNG